MAVRNEDCYEMPGAGFYKKLSNNILRHFDRMNAHNLLLVETNLWYDPLTEKDAIEIYNIYKDRLDRIPRSDTIKGVNGETFPTYILCGNKSVMRLRKSRKVLQIPYFNTLSTEEKYARTLLYYPLRPGQSIIVDRLGRKIKIFHASYLYIFCCR